jgi:hypothetical protein
LRLQKIILVFIIIIIIITLTGCSGSGGGGRSGLNMHTVQYVVSTYSNNPVAITYINEEGKTVELPSENVSNKDWTYTFSAKNGTHLYLSATLISESTDIFYATIYVDYIKEVTMSQKSGAPAVIEFTIPTG